MSLFDKDSSADSTDITGATGDQKFHASDQLHLNGVGEFVRQLERAVSRYGDEHRSRFVLHRDTSVRNDTGFTQPADYLRVGLNVLGQATYHDRMHVAGFQFREPGQAFVLVVQRPHPQLVQAGDGVSVWGCGRVVEDFDEPAFHVLAHHVFPPTCLGVHILPLQADDVDQKSLGEAMLAHDRDCHPPALVGEFQMPVSGNEQQAIPFHPGHGLAHRRPALFQPFGDSGAQGHHALLFEVVDRTEVHLRGIDQIFHCYPFVGTNSTRASLPPFVRNASYHAVENLWVFGVSPHPRIHVFLLHGNVQWCPVLPASVASMATAMPGSGAARENGATVVWTDRFLDYTWTPEHPMKPARLKYTMALARGLGVLDGVETLEPVAAGEGDLYRIHTADYVDAVRHVAVPDIRVADPPVSPPYGLGSMDNPVFPGMHQAASVIVGGTVAAARAIVEGHTRRAVSIGGGMHHAMPASAAGFCIYNDVAVAISWLLDHGFDRIAYIDVDVHHGDGVQRAFYADPRVMTVSVHQHPATLWPNTGWPEETGSGPGDGTAINLPLLPGTGDRQWLRAFHAVVPGAVEAFRPQIVLSQCGVDTHREDPLADLALTVDGQRAAFRAMRDLADEYAEGRWLAVGGGGYGLVRVVPRAWTHLLAIALDRSMPPETQIPQQWQDMVRAEVSGIEPPTLMGDGADIEFQRWDGPGGTVETGDPRVDRAQRDADTAVLATRRACFGPLGLDPEDPRD